MRTDTPASAAETAEHPAASVPTFPERFMARAELLLYVSTSVILVLAAFGLLLAAVHEMTIYVLGGHFIDALLHLLDRALLVLMMAEIIYTVRRIAHQKRLEVQTFFTVAIIAAIRRMLIITAESSQHIDLTSPVFQAALAELGVLALIILALAAAMRLVPRLEP